MRLSLFKELRLVESRPRFPGDGWTLALLAGTTTDGAIAFGGSDKFAAGDRFEIPEVDLLLIGL
jgi:hypothetical protein